MMTDWSRDTYMNTTEHVYTTESLFTKGTDVFPQDIVKSRSREIRVYTFPIALKFERHPGSIAAEMPVKFESDMVNIDPNLAASRLHEILR